MSRSAASGRGAGDEDSAVRRPSPGQIARHHNACYGVVVDNELTPPGGPPAIQGDSFSPQDELLAYLTSAWLGSLKSPHTREAYERDLRSWIAWCQGRGVHPLRARIADTDGWLAMQREHGIRGDGQPSAIRSIARRLSVVASWYDYLISNTAGDEHPLIAHNPAHTKGRPKVNPDESPTVGITRAEADRLIAAAEGHGLRSAAVIRLMLTNACRCSAITTARIEGLSHDRGHRVLTTQVKGGGSKRLPLPPPTAHAIDAYLASRGNPPDGPLFATRTGLPIDRHYLLRLVRLLANRAGIKAADRLTPHSLRHTAVTEVLDATGGDLRKAQDLAGHADPRTTRLYDRRRGELDGHAAYILATRYGADRGEGGAE